MPAKYTHDQFVEVFWSRVDKRGDDECWLWTRGKSEDGYGRVAFRGKITNAHRVAYILTHNVQLERTVHVCHSCDNPPCCNSKHLWLGSAKDNGADRHRKGRSPSHRGVLHGRAKLTEAQVYAIRSSRGTKRFVDEYGVDRTTIQKIRRGQRWTHLMCKKTREVPLTEKAGGAS